MPKHSQRACNHCHPMRQVNFRIIRHFQKRPFFVYPGSHCLRQMGSVARVRRIAEKDVWRRVAVWLCRFKFYISQTCEASLDALVESRNKQSHGLRRKGHCLVFSGRIYLIRTSAPTLFSAWGWLYWCCTIHFLPSALALIYFIHEGCRCDHAHGIPMTCVLWGGTEGDSKHQRQCSPQRTAHCLIHVSLIHQALTYTQVA